MPSDEPGVSPNEAATQPAQARLRHWLSEGFVLATISAFASTITYAYQAGYVSYFNLPSGLIRIDATSVIAAAGALGSALYLFASLIHAGFLFNGHEQPVLKASATTAFYVIVCGYLVLMAGSQWTSMSIIMAISFSLGAINREWLPWMPPATVKKPPLPTYRERLIAANIEHVVDGISSHGKSFVFGRWFIPPDYFAVVLAALLAISWWTGWGNARLTEEFLVHEPPGLTPVAVVRIFGDNAIGISFDEKTHQIGDQVRVVPMNSEHTFVRKNLGILERKPPTKK